jgi:hypothetical protein
VAEILERGDIYFLHRPRVQEHTVEGLEDVQRSYVVLSPHHERRYRLILLGQKHMPAIRDGGEKVWGFVDRVGTEAKHVEDALERETYVTETRGERVQPAARPAGEGVYAIVRHDDHTHLAYALELPAAPGEVQRALEPGGGELHPQRQESRAARTARGRPRRGAEGPFPEASPGALRGPAVHRRRPARAAGPRRR